MYYDPKETLSHNMLFNFVVSNRGAGKTFGSLKFCVQQYINKKCKFIYLRRSDVESKASKPTLLDAIAKYNVFPNCSFSIKGSTIYMERHGVTHIIGSCLSLSKFEHYKSSFFEDYKYIIFDEFLSETKTARWLTIERSKFISLYETVARTNDVKVLFLGNNVTLCNPYFDKFGINVKEGAVFMKNKDKNALLHMYFNEDFAEFKSKTRFAQTIKGTKEGDYILNNVALKDDHSQVAKITGKKQHVCNLCKYGTHIGVYFIQTKKRTCVYFSSSYEQCPAHRNFIFDHMIIKPGYRFLKSPLKSPLLVNVESIMLQNFCYYENLMVKNMVLDIFKLLC